jgi:hypothetical protein
MKIIISERQLMTILGDPDVINEQNDGNNDQRTLIILQNKINDLIDGKKKEKDNEKQDNDNITFTEKEKKFLDKIGIKVIGNAQSIKLQIGHEAFDMKLMVPGVYAYVVPPDKKIPLGGPTLAELLPEIENFEEYKQLVVKYPDLKEQISKGNIIISFYTEQNQGVFKFTVTKKPLNRRDTKTAVAFGTEYPLGEFISRNKLIYQFKNGLFGTLEFGQISIDVSSPQFKLNAATTAAPSTPIQISTVALGDLFVYDDVAFKDANIVNQQIGKFVQEVKGAIAQYGQPFIDHIKSQSPTVLGYSSIDGDPAQKIEGKYKPCAGNTTRADYDMCLSQERARIIADEINKQLPDLGNAIKFKGMGETTQFGPGWTKESPTIPEKTAPNRRYVLTPIKPFTGQVGNPQQAAPPQQ